MTPSNAHLYLDREQQDLLLAALATNSSSMFMSDPQRSQQFSRNLDALNNFGSAPKSLENRHPTAQSVQSHISDMDMTRRSSEFEYANGISPTMDNLDYSFDLDGQYDFDLGDYGVDIDDGTGTTEQPLLITESPSSEHEKRKSPPTENDGTPSADPREAEPKRRGQYPPPNRIKRQWIGTDLPCREGTWRREGGEEAWEEASHIRANYCMHYPQVNSI